MTGAATQMITCPRCGNPASGLNPVESGMRLALKEGTAEAMTSPLPAAVCKECYGELTGLVSQGAKLRMEQVARERNKHMLWKSRVNLVKQARQQMIQKAFSEAAVSYEKYLRVLEMAYDLKPGELKPDVFGKSSKSKELTVIATTYWDLFRIYDTNPNYRDRMTVAGRKLTEFLPYSPAFPDVLKKAQTFMLSAKNPDIVRDFLRSMNASSHRCFIATVAFGHPDHQTVRFFRAYRDQNLLTTRPGRAFVKVYYRLSPSVAVWISRSPKMKHLARSVLRWIHRHLEQYPLTRQSGPRSRNSLNSSS
jgi:hypothetical protein